MDLKLFKPTEGFFMIIGRQRWLSRFLGWIVFSVFSPSDSGSGDRRWPVGLNFLHVFHANLGKDFQNVAGINQSLAWPGGLLGSLILGIAFFCSIFYGFIGIMPLWSLYFGVALRIRSICLRKAKKFFTSYQQYLAPIFCTIATQSEFHCAWSWLVGVGVIVGLLTKYWALYRRPDWQSFTRQKRWLWLCWSLGVWYFLWWSRWKWSA